MLKRQSISNLHVQPMPDLAGKPGQLLDLLQQRDVSPTHELPAARLNLLFPDL